jgi:hypothetical protein
MHILDDEISQKSIQMLQRAMLKEGRISWKRRIPEYITLLKHFSAAFCSF